MFRNLHMHVCIAHCCCCGSGGGGGQQLVNSAVMDVDDDNNDDNGDYANRQRERESEAHLVMVI